MFAGQVAGKLIGMNVVGGVVHIGEAPEHSGSNITGGASISTSGGVLIAMSTIASISPGLSASSASCSALSWLQPPQPEANRSAAATNLTCLVIAWKLLRSCDG